MALKMVYDPKRRTVLTLPQLAWLDAHPKYQFCGWPRFGAKFKDTGTLYADGRFERCVPMKAVQLEEGCRLIGVPIDG